AATADEAFKIHVYVPSYAFDDMSKYYGEAITLPGASDATWKNGENEAPSTMDNTKPTLEVTMTPTPATAFDNGFVQVAEDVPVKAVIKLNSTDVTADLIAAGKITRTCTPAVCDDPVDAPTTDVAFVVHVKTVKVTVTKKISGLFADKSKEYTFNVSFAPNGTGAPTYQADAFKLGDNGTKDLTGLPLGTLTLTETGILDGYKVTFSTDGTAVTPTNGEASTDIDLATKKDANDEVAVEVTNKMEDVPITGIIDGMSGFGLVLIAGLGLVTLALLMLRKRLIRQSR
ncbi:MAG: hypothetical protein K5707_07595, partial [Clostridia bacterium]|nr:hypothetical protein [Clostridia bacterium]